MDADAYLDRIGLVPDEAAPPTLATLERLQRAHVTTVPFETLAITGHPHREGAGHGVTLALPALYEKLVERRRGGFCYELNGAFTWLLRELGFDANRVAARVISDGDRTPPANHHAIVVALDRRYLVDVGLGTPKLRRPIPLDGTPVTDAGTEWRVAAADRPDADFLVQYREDDGWRSRYDFTDTLRELAYFEATCDYLQTAPESPFTGEPTVNVATERGYKRLSPDSFSETVDGVTTERAVAPAEWDTVLEREFGLAPTFRVD